MNKFLKRRSTYDLPEKSILGNFYPRRKGVRRFLSRNITKRR